MLAKLQLSPKHLWLGRPQQRFMRWGLLFSIALHVAVLAWQRDSVKRPDPSPPLLEMVLVNASTESSPVAPTAFAQVNLDGGGEGSGGFASSTQAKLGTEAQNIVIDAMTKRRLQLEAQQTELLTLLESTATTKRIKLNCFSTLSWLSCQSRCANTMRGHASILTHLRPRLTNSPATWINGEAG